MDLIGGYASTKQALKALKNVQLNLRIKILDQTLAQVYKTSYYQKFKKKNYNGHYLKFLKKK